VIPLLAPPVAVRIIVIRTALLLGMLLFGGATWYTSRQGRVSLLSAERAQLMGWVFVALAACALGAMLFLRSRLEKIADVRQIFATYVVGYAFAEGAALFGGVVWFLGGAREWYVAGLVLMAVSFQILPVRKSVSGIGDRASGIGKPR
jgi:hypothetical protein